MMNKGKNICLILMVMFFSMCLLFANSTFAARQKSSVLTIFENKAGTTYDDALDKVVNDELQDRLEGLYIELDSEPYRHILKRVYKAEELSEREMISKVNDSGADYCIYLELKPVYLKDQDHFYYYHNSAVTTVFLWILDLKNKSTIYKDYVTLGYRDTADGIFYSVGNKSVAKKALANTMFKVGEIIAVRLPL